MELNEGNFKLMAQYLLETLSPNPDVRRPGKTENLVMYSNILCAEIKIKQHITIIAAEKFLECVEANQNYSLLLLQLVQKEAIEETIRVAAAIAFKNFIKRNWNAHAVSIPLTLMLFSIFYDDLCARIQMVRIAYISPIGRLLNS